MKSDMVEDGQSTLVVLVLRMGCEPIRGWLRMLVNMPFVLVRRMGHEANTWLSMSVNMPIVLVQLVNPVDNTGQFWHGHKL